MSQTVKTLTYADAFKVWKIVEHLDHKKSIGKPFKIERTWTSRESGHHDPPHKNLNKVLGRRRSFRNMDHTGVLLTDKHYYPFFVLKPLKLKYSKLKLD